MPVPITSRIAALIIAGLLVVSGGLCGVLFASSQVRAQNPERITDYRVAVKVNIDRTLDIREQIEIQVEGQVFKRGLLRDIPIMFRDGDNRTTRVDLDVISIRRDGQLEPYELSHSGRYARLRIGQADRLLSHGRHRYEIHYQVSDSIGFFANLDEVVWNAIGTEWPFPIDKAQVSVQLPEGADIQQYAIYIGAQGAREDAYEVIERSAEHLSVRTSRVLATGEGMTIAVGWQKGIIAPPSQAEQTLATLKQNSPLIILALAALGEMGWLYGAWRRVGKDPDGGAIIPRFSPPVDISPAIASYVVGLGSFEKSQQTSFMAALVNLAIKGYVSIEENTDALMLRREREPSDQRSTTLPPGERALFRKLMTDRSSVKFADMEYKTMAGIMGAFAKAVEKETDQVYFRRNTAYLVPGIVLAIIGLLGYIIASVAFAPPFFFPIFELVLAGFSAVFFFAGRGIWQAVWGKSKFSKGIMVPFFFLIFFGSMIGSELEGEPSALIGLDIPAALLLLVMALALFLFAHWMKAPTRRGRQVMDEVEGLKLFMTVTVAEQAKEAERADMPELTPKLYEDLLPYAIALGVESTWSALFEDKVFAQLPPDQRYQPGWYHGRYDSARASQSLAAMTDTLGTDLSSAMTPPASSSSGGSFSSGGGFSGGGGGGGGGGGW